jgi:hypothetical protein
VDCFVECLESKHTIVSSGCLIMKVCTPVHVGQIIMDVSCYMQSKYGQMSCGEVSFQLCGGIGFVGYKYIKDSEGDDWCYRKHFSCKKAMLSFGLLQECFHQARRALSLLVSWLCLTDIWTAQIQCCLTLDRVLTWCTSLGGC